MNKVLPLRFRDDGEGKCVALMPSQCRAGCDDKGIFECLGGERVRVEWHGIYRNEKGESERELESLAQRLYGWSFARLQSTWIARLGKIDGWWDLLRLVKVE